MTFAEIQTEVQDALARTDTVVTGKIGTWINRRQHTAASRHNFGFMRTSITRSLTVAAGQTYTLPAVADGTAYKDDAVFFLLKTNAYVEIPIRTQLEGIRTYSPTDTGEPVFISLEPGATSFKIWPPTTDATYTLTIAYFGWPTDLSGTGTNWFTDHFPRLLISGAMAEGYAFLSAYEDTLAQEQLFEAEFRRAKAADVERLLPDEYALAPRLDAGSGGETPRQAAGWPW